MHKLNTFVVVRTKVIFSGLLTAMILFSCSVDREKLDGNKQVFRYNESAGLTSLDPAFSRYVENNRAINHLFNGLVQMDNNLLVKPCIAKNWEISEDGLVYTFFLRNDVYFHENQSFPGGKPRKVTAQDFVYSFIRIMDAKTASPGAWIFSNVNTDSKDNLGFEAVDKYTLRIHLKEAFQPFLGLLTMKYCSVVPHEVIEDLGADFRNNPVGTGPFKFQMWKEGNKLVLLKNEMYFEKDADGSSLPKLDAVSITFIGDEEVEYLEFLKGNLDFLSGSNGSNLEFLDFDGQVKEKYRDRFTMQNQPYLNTEYLGILIDSTYDVMKASPLNDKLIRRAINLGFNRKEMIRFLKNNIGHASEEGIIPRGLPPYKEGWVKGYQYNPDSSRALLAAAGYPGGAGLKPIKLSTTSQYLTLCEYIQSQLSEIGIQLEIELNPAATNRELVALSKIAFFRKSWVADYPDAENYLALFYSGNFSPNGPNYTHFKNQTYDELYLKAKTELDREVRYDLYRQMEEIILEEAVIVPLYYDQVVSYTQPYVEKMESNPLNLFDLKRVRLNRTD